MGIEVFVYQGLTEVPDIAALRKGAKFESTGFQYAEFEGNDYLDHIGSIKEETKYSYKSCYTFEASYGNYQDWRRQLAKLAGYPKDYYELPANYFEVNKKPAFYELIFFSSNQGTIATEYSKKLAQDFIKYQDKAEALDDCLFLDRYNQWRQAFECAANNGAVAFC